MLETSEKEVQEHFMRDAVRMTNLLEGRFLKHAEALYLNMADYVSRNEHKLKKEHMILFLDISKAIKIREPKYFEQLLLDLNLLIGRGPAHRIQ